MLSTPGSLVSALPDERAVFTDADCDRHHLNDDAGVDREPVVVPATHPATRIR